MTNRHSSTDFFHFFPFKHINSWPKIWNSTTKLKTLKSVLMIFFINGHAACFLSMYVKKQTGQRVLMYRSKLFGSDQIVFSWTSSKFWTYRRTCYWNLCEHLKIQYYSFTIVFLLPPITVCFKHVRRLMDFYRILFYFRLSLCLRLL